MANTRADIAAETDLLCETCGYTLNGLQPDSRCPECGNPVQESSPTLRQSTIWERPETAAGALGRFFRTTYRILFHPATFYRSLATRQTRESSSRFGLIHCIIVSTLFGTAAYYHLYWFLLTNSLPPGSEKYNQPVVVIPFLSTITFIMLFGLTRLAARLTTWEGGYRGLRLPLPAVLRGLDYHAAHYLPVGLISAGTVVGYRYMLYRGLIMVYRGRTVFPNDVIYLYVLCGEVVVAAVYLFWTYWIGMRNMMYANA